MHLLSRLTKKGVAPSLIATSARVSGNAPLSVSVSGDNSQGASKASAEVIGYLNGCFDEFDPEGLLYDLATHICYAERRFRGYRDKLQSHRDTLEREGCQILQRRSEGRFGKGMETVRQLQPASTLLKACHESDYRLELPIC